MDHDRLKLALDRASVRSGDADGHLHVSRTPISKANVCPYYGREIPDWQSLGLAADRTYKLYRDAGELEKAAKAARGKPLLLGHKPVTAADHDYDMTVGAATSFEWEFPYVYAALDIWPGAAIDEIESGRQEQLSSAYRYRADMTPGTAPDGMRYDGVMRDIDFNHVALVPEGRAGPDVVVLDAKLPQFKDLFMTKTVAPSRAAELVRGALMAHLRPKMAADAKPIDLSPILKGLTSANFKTQKAAIAANIKKATEGKLAQDADLSDVTDLLDALEDMTPEEAEEAKKKADVAPAQDVSEEDKKVAKDAEEDDDKKDKDVKAAQDAAITAATKDMVSKPAMDTAIAAAAKAATDAAIRTQREIRDAERFVEPWVGQLAMAHDSAPDVYRSALKVLKIEGVDALHADALRPILQAQQKPGEHRAPRTEVTQDAASVESFDKMFPHANRLK